MARLITHTFSNLFFQETRTKYSKEA